MTRGRSQLLVAVVGLMLIFSSADNLLLRHDLRRANDDVSKSTTALHVSTEDLRSCLVVAKEHE